MHITKFLAIRSISGWITLLALIAIILSGVSTITYKREISLYSEQGAARLELFTTYLKGVLEKYESLPELLARDEQLAGFLNNPGGKEKVEAFNRYLATINDISNAADTYIMNREGLTVAASNWQEEHPFVGRNFSYRPYFQQAMKGQLGRYFALGTTSVKRGYYFAYPVRHQKEIIGAVVIKTNIDTVEKQWGYKDETFLVTDPENIIFLTTNPDWRFKTLGRISPVTRDLVIKSQRYPNSELQPLEISTVKSYSFGSVIIISNESNDYSTYLQQSRFMEEAGWNVQVLSNLRPIRKKIFAVNVIVGSTFVFCYLFLIVFAQRRQRLIEIKQFEDQAKKVLQEANEKLETRVTERTIELTETNKKLIREIQDRRKTEAELKTTRSELVHTAKMATLGQLSAGINHELNQPLAAIKSYADNCRQLLLKGRGDEAVWNMEQISELTDRMAQIGVQLKVFSRKTSGQLAIVPLHGAIDGALEILSPTIKKCNINITRTIEPKNLEVYANQVLLQQVIVNLLSNAIHAVEQSEIKDISICARALTDKTLLVVEDSGPGIQPDHLPQIFDPFFTTKKSGQGLGLGLTITERIIKEMGGSIVVEPSNVGARFVLTLAAVTSHYENKQ